MVGGSTSATTVGGNTVRTNLVASFNQLRNQLVTGQKAGSCTLELSLDALVRDGVVAYEEAVARSLYPKEISHPAGSVPPPR